MPPAVPGCGRALLGMYRAHRLVLVLVELFVLVCCSLRVLAHIKQDREISLVHSFIHSFIRFAISHALACGITHKQTHAMQDPSHDTKVALTEEGQEIVDELGKLVKLLTKGSEAQDVRVTIAHVCVCVCWRH